MLLITTMTCSLSLSHPDVGHTKWFSGQRGATGASMYKLYTHLGDYSRRRTTSPAVGLHGGEGGSLSLYSQNSRSRHGDSTYRPIYTRGWSNPFVPVKPQPSSSHVLLLTLPHLFIPIEVIRSTLIPKEPLLNFCFVYRIGTILLMMILFAMITSSQCSSARHHHRRHHHQHIDDDNSNNNNNSTEKPAVLQSSPKDALTVTKRRYLRQDWCQSQPLIQRVGEPQCLSTTILNRFCYGQCNSFFIPKNQLKGGESGAAFKSCAVCQPKKTSWATVTLKCPSLVPNIRRRRVQIIHQCRCMQQQDSRS